MNSRRQVETNQRIDSEKKPEPMRLKPTLAPEKALKMVPNEANFHILQVEYPQGFTSRTSGFPGAERTHSPLVGARLAPGEASLGGAREGLEPSPPYRTRGKIRALSSPATPRRPLTLDPCRDAAALPDVRYRRLAFVLVERID